MRWSDILTLHWWRKCVRHIRMLSKLFMAAMFGEYHHSGWNGEYAYTKYTWHGDYYIIPTSKVQPHEHS